MVEQAAAVSDNGYCHRQEQSSANTLERLSCRGTAVGLYRTQPTTPCRTIAINTINNPNRASSTTRVLDRWLYLIVHWIIEARKENSTIGNQKVDIRCSQALAHAAVHCIAIGKALDITLGAVQWRWLMQLVNGQFAALVRVEQGVSLQFKPSHGKPIQAKPMQPVQQSQQQQQHDVPRIDCDSRGIPWHPWQPRDVPEHRPRFDAVDRLDRPPKPGPRVPAM
jgi:hypothetical protein